MPAKARRAPARVRPSSAGEQKAAHHASAEWIPDPRKRFDREAVLALEDALIAAFAVDPTVEVDGHEFGEGKAALFVYGRDADAMLMLATPALKKNTAARPMKLTRRYGPATDPAAKEVVSEL